MSATTSNAHITDMVRQIRGLALPTLGSKNAFDNAKAQAKAQGEVDVSTREGVIRALAELSSTNQWSEQDVKRASAMAAGQSKSIESEKALATFIGEATYAMLPGVRSYVATMVKVRDAAWEAETEAYEVDKKSPTPLRKAFVRKYHCLIQLMLLARDTGRVVDTIPELLELAEERNPDYDIKAVRKRLDRITADLTKFYHDFPSDYVQLVIEAMQNVHDKDLTKARKELVGEAEKRLQSHPVPSSAFVPTLVPNTPEPEVEEPETDAVEDAFSILDLEQAAD